MRASQIYYLREKVRFTNPFLNDVPADYYYSFVLVKWESLPAAEQRPWLPLDLPRVAANDPAQLLRVRRCTSCGKYRVLPRHQSEPCEPFVCSALHDQRIASCSAPCHVWMWA